MLIRFTSKVTENGGEGVGARVYSFELNSWISMSSPDGFSRNLLIELGNFAVDLSVLIDHQSLPDISTRRVGILLFITRLSNIQSDAKELFPSILEGWRYRNFCYRGLLVPLSNIPSERNHFGSKGWININICIRPRKLTKEIEIM